VGAMNVTPLSLRKPHIHRHNGAWAASFPGGRRIIGYRLADVMYSCWRLWP
jgi:hypothetical protein